MMFQNESIFDTIDIVSCMVKKKDLTGLVFGDLKVIKLGPSKVYGKNKFNYWICVCSCGKESLGSVSKLLSGRKVSCGCKNFTTPHPNRKIRDGKITSYLKIIAAYEHSAARKAKAAKPKDIKWLLSYEEAVSLFNGNCFYCGATPSNPFNVYITKAGKYISKNKEFCEQAQVYFNGIDRLDSSSDYVIGNVASCCKTCNFAKLQMSCEKFYKWIEKIAVHQGFSKGIMTKNEISIDKRYSRTGR